jgi:CheY-like chemotaxis protein
MERESVVLIADDDENDVFLMKRAFEKANVSVPVMVVRNGEEAIGYLSGKGKYGNRKVYPLPMLMLLDLKMPMVDGFEVLAWCREQGHERSIPIVVMSSSNYDSDIARAMVLGATAYRVKPADFQYLVAVAKELRDIWLKRGSPTRDLAGLANFTRTGQCPSGSACYPRGAT